VSTARFIGGPLLCLPVCEGFAEGRMGESKREVVRCRWASNPLNIPYHDEEWGVPVHNDHQWFEFLILEGAQAGLSWDTILQKRARYQKVYAGFDPGKVARFDAKKSRQLLGDAGIIRNRLKIAAAVTNAQAHQQLPAVTPLATALSKDLKKRGFRFVGPTIVYAFMQATGLVNDHLVSCFRYKQVAQS
jgi:DNA-3-methyladenine glycosylase I